MLSTRGRGGVGEGCVWGGEARLRVKQREQDRGRED